MTHGPQPLTLEQCAQVLTAPTGTSHKYTRGVLGLLTGSDSYPGAALMSARAAVNTGAGMVRFLGTSSLNLLMHLSVPEAVCTVTSTPEKTRVDAWALGSGVSGQDRENQLRQILQAREPGVIDAGAVALASQLVAVDGLELAAHHIITPHAGEAADALTWLATLKPQLLPELTEVPSRHEIENEPARYARILAGALGVTVLLKGGSTTISEPSGQTYTVTGNSPWLATAGSGDTLAGILGALLARYQAETPAEARKSKDYALLSAAAVLIHGKAAEHVHPAGMPGPLPPTLVAEHIPGAVAQTLASHPA
ncbi:ADP-dependent NAD(P)H-hydrate dehydratase [Rothia sp. P5764]|uniref:ADP-dependent NAD(P)H-hydrate dehydratase n=1 Tax=Rothia sp. P5764 TaxID=3402654 RepID=UPI003ACC25C0